MVAVGTYLVAKVAYTKELDLYEYFLEIEYKNFYSQKWSLDFGFSTLLYLLSPLIFSPEILSITLIIIVFIISLRAFEGNEYILKSTLFCLSYPVLLGAVNQLRATLFMTFFLYALSGKKEFRLIKIMIAGSMHIYSMILFAPIALRRFSIIWVSFFSIIIVVFANKYYYFTFNFVDIWKSYEEVNVDLFIILVKVCICAAYIRWLENRSDAFIIVLIATILFAFGMSAILDRFLTLAIMLIFFYYLKNMKLDSLRFYKYLVFGGINIALLANSSLLWAL